jgi:hypothetical protein
VRTLFFALLPSAVLIAAEWPQNPSLIQLKGAIANRGADKVTAELMKQEDPDPWASIEDHVASGDARWLELADQLRRYTDAGVSESLDNAVSEALSKNPAAVLRILSGDPGKGFAVRHVCSTETFIEPPPGKMRRYLRQARFAVERVTEPQLEKVKQACLESLDHELYRK